MPFQGILLISSLPMGFAHRFDITPLSRPVLRPLGLKIMAGTGVVIFLILSNLIFVNQKSQFIFL